MTPDAMQFPSLVLPSAVGITFKQESHAKQPDANGPSMAFKADVNANQQT
jgi:hypothetical protein